MADKKLRPSKQKENKKLTAPIIGCPVDPAKIKWANKPTEPKKK